MTHQRMEDLTTIRTRCDFLRTTMCGVATATLIGILIGYPNAYPVTCLPSDALRKLWIGSLIAMRFLSVLERVYSIQLALGPLGFFRQISALKGWSLNSIAVAETMIVAGLLHYMIPIADLTISAASLLLMGFTLARIFLLDRMVGLDTVVGQGIYRA